LKELYPQHWIKPLVSDRTMAGYDEKMHPVLARKSHVQAKKNCANVSAFQQLFGPIHLETGG
jgi:hypothetical protein